MNRIKSDVLKDVPKGVPNAKQAWRLPFVDTARPLPRTLFFDYDGCLHDSLKIYAPAFRAAQDFLVAKGLTDPRDWSDAEIRQWIGLTPTGMWQRFRPDLSPEVTQQASAVITENMLTAIRAGQARLYEGGETVLQTLIEQGYRLVLISHCKTAYLEAHRNYFQLDRYFAEVIASENWGYQDKAAILAQVSPHYPGPFAMIGDRASDILAGRANQMLTIGCTYGYAEPGELDPADLRIDAIGDLPKILSVRHYDT